MAGGGSTPVIADHPSPAAATSGSSAPAPAAKPQAPAARPQAPAAARTQPPAPRPQAAAKAEAAGAASGSAPAGVPAGSSPSSGGDSETQAFAPPPRRPTLRQRTLRSCSFENIVETRFVPHVTAREKDQEVCSIVRAAIGEVHACARLTKADINAIIEALRCFELEPGFVLQKQGEATELFMVVQEGKLEVSIDLDDQPAQPPQISKVAAGSAWGAESLLYGCPRTTVVTAIERTIMWGASGGTFQQVLRERARANCAEHRKFMVSNSLFAGLEPRQMDLLSQALIEEAYPPGSQVVVKGDDQQTFYCVRSGTLRVLDTPPGGGAPQELAILRPGDCFGERALLYGERRAATVMSIGRCELLCIGASQLRSVLGTDLHAYLERSLILQALRISPGFSQFARAQQSAVMQVMETKEVPANETIAKAVGSKARAVVVVTGLIQQTPEGGGEAVVISRGECCEVDTRGRIAVGRDGVESPARRAGGLVDSAIRLGDFVAGSEGARISVLTQDNLVRGLGRKSPTESAEQAAEYAAKMLLVRKVPVFRHLNHEQTESVVSALRLQQYRKDELVIEQGTSGSSMYVISRGEVSIFIGEKLVRTQGRNACFGERALLFDERRTATVKVTSEAAEIWTIDKATFGEIVKGKMREDLIKRIKIQDTQVTLPDLRPVKIIGTGAFSVVRLVEHQRTGVRYALKSVKKHNGRIPPDMVNECAILLENDHPFILYVVKTFETDLRVCMLTELLTGGDLHGSIRQIPTVLSRRQAQFYVGSLVIAIEALWDRNIIYRDLKPENVMLDSQGYLKIIDFGISKKLKENESRTFTTVGTPHYMAPEVMQGRGYGIEVDIWCLGIMLFEFVCGYLPFADELDEPAEVCNAVLTNRLVFPRTYRDAAGRDLIQGLLCRQPERRLGAGANGCADIKAASFFRLEEGSPEELFDKIMGRELDPPLVPQGETYCDEEAMEMDQCSDAEDLFQEAPTTSQQPATQRPGGGSLRASLPSSENAKLG